MITQELIDYINHQLANGATPEEIKTALKHSGWSDEIIAQVFAQLNLHTPPTPPYPGQLPH